jgi:hypothetical protein
MFFGPHLRFRRPLRRYAADAESKKANAEESPCYREGQSGRQLLPGLLTVFCEHEVCHGYTVLTEPESERHVFQLTYCRMPTGHSFLLLAALISSLQFVFRTTNHCLRSGMQTACVQSQA